MRLNFLKTIFSPHHANTILGINRRNHDFIQNYNPRRYFPFANNKLLTKTILEKAGIPTAKTYYVCKKMGDLSGLKNALKNLNEFVLKPAQGKGGAGILVCSRHSPSHWLASGGTSFDINALRGRVADILFGAYSLDQPDQAIFEETLKIHPRLAKLSEHGLSDLRVICFKGNAIQAMLRLPTAQSGGRANLHQGGIGLGISIEKGISTSAIYQNQIIHQHPETGIDLKNFHLPHWSKIIQISQRAAKSVPLRYLGVDIAITKQGPKILEINARPGLEIQNANKQGLRPLLAPFHSALRS